MFSKPLKYQMSQKRPEFEGSLDDLIHKGSLAILRMTRHEGKHFHVNLFVRRIIYGYSLFITSGLLGEGRREGS